jgi:hypothetical protein
MSVSSEHDIEFPSSKNNWLAKRLSTSEGLYWAELMNDLIMCGDLNSSDTVGKDQKYNFILNTCFP